MGADVAAPPAGAADRADFTHRVGREVVVQHEPLGLFTEQAIDRVVQKLLALGEKEVPARLIGDLVMNELKRLDKVAYIRFASVYRAFQDVDDFRDAIRDVEARDVEKP